MKRTQPYIIALLLIHALSVWMATAIADSSLSIEVEGVSGAMGQNVRDHIRSSWTLQPRLDSKQRRSAFIEQVERQASQALRPWGHYRPMIDAQLERSSDTEGWRVVLRIQPGPPVRIENVAVSVTGAGAGEAGLQRWQNQWPLVSGQALDQTVWEKSKNAALELAQALGYLQASFKTSRIALDLERDRADLELELETGLRAVMGEVLYRQDVVDTAVLAPLSRFVPGDPYLAERIDDLRLDLWKTGYFDEIEVIEQPREATSPQVVDLLVRLEARHKSTHQLTLGYGTDTQARTQYNWIRHRLTTRGDSLGTALGWRQRYSEILASMEYRLPRKVDSLQFWVMNGAIRRENQDFFILGNDGSERLRIASGEVLDGQLKTGRLRLIDTPWSSDRIAETTFVALLREKNSLEAVISEAGDIDTRDPLEDLLGQKTQSVSIGMEWDWPMIRDRGFLTTGQHHRAWWFTANEAWGSDSDFTQVYLSSRWIRLLSDRFKLLLRGEIGYTDADVRTFDLGPPSDPIPISITDLPYRYSFKTGGSQSVRGYRYDRLSNNGVGSNHLLVGSVELEFRLSGDWSAATFYDVGNAFNDWGTPELKRGWGFGIRWYSIIGSVRADFGRAEDIEGQPWEFYLTIGTPLL